MKGQEKELIPTLNGIMVLLLIGISAIILIFGEERAVQIPETHAITLEAQSRQTLATAFREGADVAAEQTAIDIAEDLAVELNHSPTRLIAMSEVVNYPARAGSKSK